MVPLRRWVAGCLVMAIVLCGLMAPAIANTSVLAALPWSYGGATGPGHWGELKPDFAICASGRQQSPIDLASDVDRLTEARGELVPIPERLTFDYHPNPLAILNNERTILVPYAPGSRLVMGERAYDLLQFHFHDPSEHTLDGAAYPMEAHLVHQDPETGELVVVAVFLEVGEENSTLAKIWPQIPEPAAETIAIAGIEVDATDLLPRHPDRYYQYRGSLTTPPCTEAVSWIVMETPITLSARQLDRFVGLVGSNARPLQVRGDRVARYSRSGANDSGIELPTR